MKIRRRTPNPPINVDIVRYQVQLPEQEPRNILEKIVWQKEIQVDKMRENLSLLDLKKKVADLLPTKDFLSALKQGKTSPALIAEVKKASPSKGLIRENFDPVAIAKAYEQGNATCLSVLTDSEFFQGSFENLNLVRKTVDIPLLCKEFIIYPYQIYYARLHGADAVLLITAILSDQDLKYFLKISQNLGMTALIEVHTKEELERVLTIEGVNLIGINNRNLEDFSVSLETTCEILASKGNILKDKNILVVSESGLHTSADINQVQKAGVDAVLIGESLMKQEDLIQAINHLFPS